MCGIIASFRTQYKKGKEKVKPKEVNQNIINQFEDQHSRGTEGFGIIRINGHNNIEIDRACETAKFIIDLYRKPSKMIIAHHRKPTSTNNKLDQTHPIKVSNKELKKDYLVIHNGIIGNCKEIKKEHENFLGFNYNTEYFYKYTSSDKIHSKFNDSEALAIELALFIENKSTKINTESAATFIVLQLNKKTKKAEKVYFGRNGSFSDLKMSKTRGCLDISSEGKGNEITKNKLYSFSIKDKEMRLTKKDIKFETDKKEETKTTWEKNKKNKSLFRTDLQINKVDNNKEDTELLSPYREWIMDPEEIEISENIIDKNHLSDCQEAVTSAIKNMTSEEIFKETEAALEDQTKFITDIIERFQESLMLYNLNKKEIGEYVSKMATVMKTMSKITDTTEEKYRDITLEEEIKEYGGLNPKDYDDSFLNDEDYFREDKIVRSNKSNQCGFQTHQL